MDIKTERKRASAITIANINMLVSGIIKNIAGNDISTTIGDNPISQEMVCAMVASRISTNLVRTGD